MIRPLLAAAASLAVLTTAPMINAQEETEQHETIEGATLTASELLEPYFEALAKQIDLPVAPEGRALPGEYTVVTRIAFGSCNSQSRSQHMWAQIARTDPDLFMLIGDNVYGDRGWEGDASLASLRAAYAKQSSHPEFQAFRAAVPMLTTWDDHDFGLNDGGGAFAFKTFAEDIYETYWGASDEVRGRPGIYEARTFGIEGQRVQIIMLDTRFFRSSLAKMEEGEERPPLGPYLQRTDAGADMLGDAQWQWLEQELSEPADLRILVSSIQVLTDAHNYESWEALPTERARLIDMLEERASGGLVMLSGDRHAGGIYTANAHEFSTDNALDAVIETAGEPLWELTSSSLNLAFNETARNTAREPDDRRITDFISEENFGFVEIDWPRKEVRLELRGSQGEVRASQTIGWN